MYIHIYVRVCVCVCVCTYISIHIYTYLHTHTRAAADAILRGRFDLLQRFLVCCSAAQFRCDAELPVVAQRNPLQRSAPPVASRRSHG